MRNFPMIAALAALVVAFAALYYAMNPTPADLSGLAAAGHSHDGFAAADHAHEGVAAADHAHDGFASVDHTHEVMASPEAVTPAEEAAPAELPAAQ